MQHGQCLSRLGIAIDPLLQQLYGDRKNMQDLHAVVAAGFFSPCISRLRFLPAA
jgi:hypothetical protein